jgi:hypothetical protein
MHLKCRSLLVVLASLRCNGKAVLANTDRLLKEKKKATIETTKKTRNE